MATRISIKSDHFPNYMLLPKPLKKRNFGLNACGGFYTLFLKLNITFSYGLKHPLIAEYFACRLYVYSSLLNFKLVCSKGLIKFKQYFDISFAHYCGEVIEYVNIPVFHSKAEVK